MDNLLLRACVPIANVSIGAYWLGIASSWQMGIAVWFFAMTYLTARP
jgi:hypothetical protein